MLKKLLKYEFIATGRIFLPLYGALIVVSFLQKLFFDFNFGNMRSISLNILVGAIPVLFTTLVVAVIVTTFIMMIMRFYKNLLSSEGYLMFTLPVSVSKLIWSKLLVILVWIILSGIVGMLAFCIIFLNITDFALAFSQMISVFIEAGKQGLWPALIEFIILMASIVISFILSIYLSMAVGQLSDKHKILCSIGAYIGLNIVINNIIMAVFVGVANGPVGEMIYRGIFENLSEMESFNIVMIGFIVLYVILCVVYFILTKTILTKKLNLE